MVERRIRNAQVAGSIPADGSILIMTNKSFKEITRAVLHDRSLMIRIIVLLAITILLSVWIGLSVKPSDVTVYTRYSAFGQVHFYKEHWQYFLLFVAYIWIVAGLHGGLMVKFSLLERPKTSKAILWYTIALLLLSLMYILNVIALGQAA